MANPFDVVVTMLIVWVAIACFLFGGLTGIFISILCFAHDPYEDEGREDK